jgi:septum formation protein
MGLFPPRQSGQFIRGRKGCMLRPMQNPSKPLIYLASASPRRSALLAQIGITHAVMPVNIDETVQPAEAPDAYVCRLATEKARALWDRKDLAESLPVLAADTCVALGTEIMGKPHGEQDGVRMLSRLSARTHRVYTAVALTHPGGCDTRLNVSEVSFRALTEEEMFRYWRTGEPADKAGGYAVQGLAAIFIDRIAGSFSGIMGLPLFETGELLACIGWKFQGATTR